MSLKINKSIVSVDWLNNHLNDDNLIILDCTMPKVTAKSSVKKDKEQIKGAIFFDIKKVFSDVNAAFPNTIISPEEFQIKAQNIGVNKNSLIVCYDDLGIYSSPRVWWMFQLMGFKNIAVLDGGLPLWKEKNYIVEKPLTRNFLKGDFTVNYQAKKVKYTKDILASLNNDDVLVVDARSKGRFYSTAPEPRSDVKGGHIPNSVSLPFSEIIENGKYKSEMKLKEIFNQINPDKKDFIFSCGTGITASILALGAEISEIKNHAVYDGSWTEWGSTKGLPIEK